MLKTSTEKSFKIASKSATTVAIGRSLLTEITRNKGVAQNSGRRCRVTAVFTARRIAHFGVAAKVLPRWRNVKIRCRISLRVGAHYRR
ncbi:hypothetical protein IF1G_00504 [Cordyceps javanica]|uniref:Uncharacterized protein n=1 Tax=Cordyceps javanica TaxID=43265 RepID=A0A545VFS7_9HYPO|nr:hypothetical protein IF1G_00504 [Cordyceps javanica]